MPGSVVVAGATSTLGSRLIGRMAGDPAVTAVTALESAPSFPADTSAVVVLGRAANGGGVPPDGSGLEPDVAQLREGLAGAAAAGARSVVVLSSAMVYVAWENNAVPLTEDAVLRPDPAEPFAVTKAQLERIAADWAADHPDTAVAVLRPVRVIAEGRRPTLWPRGPVVDEHFAPVQFVHVDDLAAAVDLARREHLRGAFNVAPEGWVSPDGWRDLHPVPAGVAAAAGRALSAVPGGLGRGASPYLIRAWVVASDRLRASGWQPEYGNEESIVAAEAGRGPGLPNAGRRQVRALAAVVGVVAGVAAAAVVAARRRSR